MSYELLLPYAQTNKQKIAIEALIKHGSHRKAATALGLAKSTLTNRIGSVQNIKAKYDAAPEYIRTTELPDPLIIDRTTTAYDADGNIERQWVKAKADKNNQIADIRSWLEDNLIALPKYDPVPLAEQPVRDLMSVYPLGDPHIGMAAYLNEAGEHWDLLTTKNTYLSMFDRLIQAAPPSKEAVIVNLGDYFHADNMAGVTTRSNHSLSMAGNYLSMFDLGMEIMLYMVNSALRYHGTVRVINALGNHDDTGAVAMQVALKHIYANDPRVIVNVTQAPYNFVRFGKCLFGVHHGHTTKADKLPLVMATDKPMDWGETAFRYWYTGHIHHDTLKEYSGCKVETFRTMAAKDAYATWGGYRSDRDSKVLVLDKEFGEIERHTINIAQIG